MEFKSCKQYYITIKEEVVGANVFKMGKFDSLMKGKWEEDLMV